MTEDGAFAGMHKPPYVRKEVIGDWSEATVEPDENGLLPCHHCNSNATWIVKKPATSTHEELGYIECVMACLRTSGNESRERAMNTWNNRKLLPRA